MKSLLEGWDNFLVIVGGAAAGLTGLTFIVITLSAQAGRVNESGLRTFVTPTIVHFSSALGLAALLSMPNHSVLSLAALLAACGVAGVGYIAAVAFRLRRMPEIYVPVREDWLWVVVVPGLAYALLLVGAALVFTPPRFGMKTVAAALLLLLLAGIHNAWDIAVWHSVRAPGESGANGGGRGGSGASKP
jgi:hypothetical protein